MEFTTTSCLRPELLVQTYENLSDCLLDRDLSNSTLHINIDPVPVERDVSDVLAVARRFFGNVEYRIGEQGGNFAKAVKWCFQQPSSKHFFHVEDDWIIHDEFSVDEIVQKIKKTSSLQSVLWHKPRENRVHFTPSIFHTSRLQSILKEHPFPLDSNPEAHLIWLKTRDHLVDYNVCFYGVHVQDIGREWQQKHGIQRDYNEWSTNEERVQWAPWIINGNEPKTKKTDHEHSNNCTIPR